MTNIDKIRAALEQAGEYIRSDLASERGAFEGHEGVSRIDEIKADLANSAAALAALAELEKACADAELAVRVHRGIADGYHDALKIWRQRAEQAEARLAALAELERAAAEPVAWMWEDMLGISHTYVSSKRPTWPDDGASPEMEMAINVRPLYAAPVAEIREVVVTDEMCGRVFAAACGTEVSDGAFRVTRKLLAAWRAELGPALGLVEMREPTQEEGEAIYKHWEHAATGCRPLCQSGRDMFNAVRAVMWPKEGL